jgi:hypothetical protein
VRTISINRLFVSRADLATARNQKEDKSSDARLQRAQLCVAKLLDLK